MNGVITEEWGETDSPATWLPDSSEPITKCRNNSIKMITKGRNPKYPGSRQLRLQRTELERSWVEAATSQTPLSLNHATANRLGVEPPLGFTARYRYEVYTFISHISGAPSLNTETASALPLASVFQCQIVTVFSRHANSMLSVTNSLYEGSETRVPRAECSPPVHFIRPAPWP